MSKKLLSEMFGIVGIPAINTIREDDEIDRVNKQLSGAQSVAGNRGGAQAKTGQGLQGTQDQLNGARSVFKKEAAPGGMVGLTVDGDKETLGALMECLQEAEHAHEDPDVATWAGKAWKAVAAGIRGSGAVTLPKFEQTPEDLMPDDGMGGGEQGEV